MFQLVLTVIAIALSAALAMASINYLPWWQKGAADTEAMLRTSLVQVEQAYDVVARAASGVAPEPTADSDGGFSTHFLPALIFTPAAPAGFTWVYGKHDPTDGSRYAGMHYFCLKPSSGSTGAAEGIYKGALRAVKLFSPDQAFMNTACGATTNWGPQSAYPVTMHITFYVTYTPGISR